MIDNGQGAMMADESQQQQTPEGFLNALGSTLKSTDGIDTDLVDVLTAHVLLVTQNANAVAQAKTAIVKLAETRADQNPPETIHG